MQYIEKSPPIIRLTFPGLPFSAKRPRIGKRGAHSCLYDPMSEDKRKLRYYVAGEMIAEGYKPFEDIPIAVNIAIFYPIPTSFSEKKRKSLDGKWCVTKPDNDNVEKFYFDLLSDLVYIDDRYIALNMTTKAYSFDPRVEIEIAALKEYS